MRTLRESLEATIVALDAVQQDDHVKVWQYCDAPPALQGLSQNGGDEDWLALVPTSILETASGYIPWLEVSAFGCCHVCKYPIAGAIVYIGCHA